MGLPMPPHHPHWIRLVPLLASLALGVSCATGPGGSGINPALWQALTGDAESASLQQAEARHQSLRRDQRIFAPAHPDAAAVQHIVDRLVAASFKPGVPIRSHVIVDAEVHAFSTGGHRLYVHRGLLAAARSESEIAFVLGHELGHIHAAHLERGDAVRTALRKGHPRSHEAEADILATRYTELAGFDAIAGALFLEGLREDSPSWLERHPAPPQRVESVRQASRHFRGTRAADPGQMSRHAHVSLVTLERLCADARQLALPGCELPDVAAAPPTRDQIRSVQRRLGEGGYSCGGADGLVGPRTRGCLEAFQRDRGLPVTGQPDVRTRRSLGLE